MQDNEYPFMFSVFFANVFTMPATHWPRRLPGQGRCDVQRVSSQDQASSAPQQGAPNVYTFFVDAASGAPVQMVFSGFEEFAEPSNTGSPSGGFLNLPTYTYAQIDYANFVPNHYNASSFAVPSL